MMNNNFNQQNNSMAELNDSSASNFNGAGELVSKSQVDQKLMVSQLY